METSARHASLHVFVLHKLLPHETGAMILRHQHGDSQIQAEDVRVVPVRQGIESVAEAVLCPHLLAIWSADMAQDADAIVKKKRERTSRRARNYASIHRANWAALRRRTTPRCVPFNVIGCADAPKIIAVIRKVVME